MSRGVIIKFEGYINIPEEFDFTQTIDKFKPMLVASLVNDTMDGRADGLNEIYADRDYRMIEILAIYQ